MGDSAGGTISMALVQRLVKNDQALPGHLILITSVFDSNLSNPQIREIDPKDPMLSRVGAHSAKMMSAKGADIKDPMLSPLYGDFQGLPDTTMFLVDLTSIILMEN